MPNMTEDERRAIVEGPTVYLHDGLKAELAGERSAGVG